MGLSHQDPATMRLKNGNTLIASGRHSVVEVSPDKKVVWESRARSSNEVNPKWMTCLQERENGKLHRGQLPCRSRQPANLRD